MKKTLIVAILGFLIIPSIAQASSIFFITDSHAGGAKYRNRDKASGICPKCYNSNIKLIKRGVRSTDVIVMLGDNTNTGSKSEAKKIKKALSGNQKVIWVKGNHDKNKAWSQIKKPKNYFEDVAGYRIITLDTTVLNPGSTGYLSESQIAWLKEKLQTERPVIIAMHHSPYDAENKIFFPIYDQFRSVVEEAGNVEYVMTGHLHTYDECQNQGGVKYCGVKALSLLSHQGNYKVISGK